MPQKSELPEGWVEVKFEDIAAKIPYPIGDGDHGQIKPSCYQNQGIPYIRVADLRWGSINPEKMVFIPEYVHNQNLKSELMPEDVLIAKTGATIGKCAIIPDWIEKANTSASIGKITVNKKITSSKWVLYYLLSEGFKKQMWAVSEKTAQPGFGIRDLKKFLIFIPPLAEQHRIVAAIESLFARLDETETRLGRVPGILKKFRQAVLAAACEGRLTEEWRAKNIAIQNKIEEHNKPSKLKNEFDSPIIPKNWYKCNIEPLLISGRSSIKTGPFGSMLKKHEHQKEGIPVFGIENVRKMKFIPGSKIYINSEKSQELSNYDAKEGDILISRSGTVGEICIVPEGCGEARISSNLMRIRLDNEKINPQFFCILFNGSSSVLRQISNLCGGSTRDFINGRILRSISFTIPPLPEQHEIVRRVDALFALADRIESEVAAARKKTEKLRQSILAQAFSGELVPTEAELARREGREYEDAGMLLERIKSDEPKQKIKSKKIKKSN